MFRHCINKSKYEVVDTDHNEAAQRHHSELKSLASKAKLIDDDRTLLPPEPAAETGGETAAEPAAETGGETAEPAADPAIDACASEESRPAEKAEP